MSYEVRLAARAEADIREAYEYIARRGPADPAAWKAGLDRKLTTLERFPEACGLAPESEFANVVLRQTFHGPFRILFTIRDRTVFVVTVRHGARREMGTQELDEIA